MKRFVLLVVILFSLVAGCSSQQITGRNPGVLRDQIFSIEPRANGTVSVWMVHDNLGTYCTADQAVVTELNTIFYSPDPTAFITYRTFQIGDPQCGQEGSAKNGFTTYLILAVKPLGQ